MTEQQPLAGRFQRLAATVIDHIALLITILVLVLVTGTFEHAEDYAGSGAAVNLALIIVASYLGLNTWHLWRHGQTLGKAALKIRIVTESGAVPALWKLLLLRGPFLVIPYTIALGAVGLLPVLDHLFIFGKTKRCLHDYVAGTIVVRNGGATSLPADS